MKGEGALQWGRGFVAAEAWWVSREYEIPFEASMGPRLCSRGGSAEQHAGIPGVELQWGRGFVAAEATRPAR